MGNNFVFNKSFQLLRTNPLLTTNLQIVVNSKYKLFLETLNSNKQLSDDRFKHYSITKESYLDQKIPLFFENLPSNIAFDVKFDFDQNIMYDDYRQQFDEIYWAGGNNIKDQWHKEEYEYFAPLYIRPDYIPSNFIILRVNDPAYLSENNKNYTLDAINSSNFRTEIIDKWTCVSNFDMTYQSDFGYWLNKNFVNNDTFPIYPFELDVKPYNFSRWYGIDYKSGVYTEKNTYLKDKLWFENPHFNLESFITDGWRRNELIYPHILNLKFLFDDTPATPFKYNKYSINRYYGFYADTMTLVKRITSYVQPELKPDLKIKNNIFMPADVSIVSGSTNPLIDEWNDNQNYWICTNNNLYKLYRNWVDLPGQEHMQYGIICEESLNIDNLSDYLNYEVDIIFESTGNTYRNKIQPRYNLSVDVFYDDNGVNELYGDLYLININGVFHVIKYNSTTSEFYIQTDYGIRSDSSQLKYWVQDENTKSTTIRMSDVLLNNDQPTSYPIYRVKFCDVREFDFDRVTTHYADFDFEQEYYVDTPEHKLYATEHMDDSFPKSFKIYPISHFNERKTVIVSSEYVATDELFEINKFGLSDIWRKNPSICKWGFVGSNSHSDYPYKFNNSNKVGSTFNRTTNPFLFGCNPIDKTMDHLLRIGYLYSGLTSDKVNYKQQGLYVETETYTERQFNLDYYLAGDFDYFDYFFKNTRFSSSNDNLDGHLEQTTKYSFFIGGDTFNNSYTLFKGLKYNLRTVNNVIRQKGKIEQILTEKENYNDYKFSAIINYRYADVSKFDTDVYDSKNIIPHSNSIFVFLNKKYKNVLIIVNSYNISNIWSFNDVSLFDERNGYYTGYSKINNSVPDYDPRLLCAANYVSALNNLNDMTGFDQYVTYYYIDENNNQGQIEMGTDDVNYELKSSIYNIESWKKNHPPFIIDIEVPIEILLKQKSYITTPLKGPQYNIYDKYKESLDDLQDSSNVVEPLARIIEINENETKPRPIEHGEDNKYDKKIFRFNGPYEPIFKEIELFDKIKYWTTPDGYFEQSRYAGTANLTQSTLPTIDDTINQFANIPREVEPREVGGGVGRNSIINGFGGWVSNTLSNILNGCNNTGTYLSFFNPTPAPDKLIAMESNILYLSNFGFNLPFDAVIDNIDINIRQRALICVSNNFIYSKTIQLINNDILIGNNLAPTIQHSYTIPELSSLPDQNIPIVNRKGIEAPSSDWGLYTVTGTTNTWNTTLSPSIINYSSFGVALNYTNVSNETQNSIEIDCVNITIRYHLSSLATGQSYFISYDRNLKFNTDLYMFGEIEELVYSKVNHEENVLKIKHTEEDLSIYPMVDEFGYNYDYRFIFKSTWDKNYYIKTLNSTKKHFGSNIDPINLNI